MFHEITIGERAVLHINGRPVRWLTPGRHFVFQPWRSVKVVRFKVDALVAPLRPEEAALAPVKEVRQVHVHSHERGVVWCAGKPAVWLRPGVHHVFAVDPSVEIDVMDTTDVVTPPLDPQVRKLAPSQDYVELAVLEGTVALRYVDGVLQAVLQPGRHAAWQTLHAVQLVTLDLRERVLHLHGQEVLTKDRVSLRLNVSVTFRIADPKAVATVARDADEVLYLAAQMAAREAVGTRTLDVLVGARGTLGEEMFAEVERRGAAVGLAVSGVGVKDMVLPGDIRLLMNKVVEAQKAAEANVIMRREETAATRSLAQTAQLLEEHPLLVRLKELEAYKDLAASVGNVHLFVGKDGLPGLQLNAG